MYTNDTNGMFGDQPVSCNKDVSGNSVLVPPSGRVAWWEKSGAELFVLADTLDDFLANYALHLQSRWESMLSVPFEDICRRVVANSTDALNWN